MDPLSQAVVGSAFAGSAAKRQQLKPYLLIGALAGMAPDLDILIRSGTDPLLFLEYHRQFTHALMFIPIGGLAVGLALFYLCRRWFDIRRRDAIVAATLGWGSHGLLDAFTSYGTQLLWPFSNARISWDSISIVDPILTLGALTLLLFALIRKRATFSRLAVSYIAVCLSVGVIQHHRAIEYAQAHIHSRGHHPEEITAKPSFANLMLWRTVYTWNDRYYVDAVNVGPNPAWYSGTSVEKYEPAQTCLTTEQTQLDDIRRFGEFSKGYTAIDPNDRHLIIDVRYSMVPNDINALWGIRFHCNGVADQHVDYEIHREITNEKRQRFFTMLRGN